MQHRFETLPIFQEAHSLVLYIYSITKGFPNEEKYGLTSQLRRSTSSIPANIIEGNSRKHKKEYLTFLYVAKGSLEETKYHLFLAKDLQYINDLQYKKAIESSEKVGKQLSGLINFMEQKMRIT